MTALLLIIAALCVWAWVTQQAAELFVAWMYRGER